MTYLAFAINKLCKACSYPMNSIVFSELNISIAHLLWCNCT